MSSVAGAPARPSWGQGDEPASAACRSSASARAAGPRASDGAHAGRDGSASTITGAVSKRLPDLSPADFGIGDLFLHVREAVIVGNATTGVSPDAVPRLFGHFGRGDRSDASPGLGLGLYTARGLAVADRGDLSYQEHVPSGACFAVSLPAPVSNTRR